MSLRGLHKALELVTNSNDRERIKEEIKRVAWGSGHSEDCASVRYGDWCECYGPPLVPDCPHVSDYQVCMECGGVKRSR